MFCSDDFNLVATKPWSSSFVSAAEFCSELLLKFEAEQINLRKRCQTTKASSIVEYGH